MQIIKIRRIIKIVVAAALFSMSCYLLLADTTESSCFNNAPGSQDDNIDSIIQNHMVKFDIGDYLDGNNDVFIYDGVFGWEDEYNWSIMLASVGKETISRRQTFLMSFNGCRLYELSIDEDLEYQRNLISKLQKNS